MRFTLMAINFVQDFRGNKDQNTIVFHKLRTARFIRILPQSWYGHVSMQMEFYGCPGRRIILNLKQSPLPQGTVIIYRQGGGGVSGFWRDRIVFRGKGGERLVVAYRVQKGFQENYCQCGRLQEYCRALWADPENTTKVYRRPPPPLLLPFPPTKTQVPYTHKKDNNDNKKDRNT